jgi:hypothetical protein
MEQSSSAKKLPLPKVVRTYLKENISSSFHFPIWNKGRIICQRSQLKKLQPAMLVSDAESSSDESAEEPVSTMDGLISFANISIPSSTSRKKKLTDENSGKKPSIKKVPELLPL